ncbi:MAG: hypothetical protein M3081_01610 [Gemmatimonadota bacterium]|nr:hypothetical protein [Gemmatimonadota bacterium]
MRARGPQVRGALAAIALFGATACRNGHALLPAGPEYASAAELGLQPCRVTNGSNVNDWREVEAEGFRFCVPQDWHQVDPGLVVGPSGGWVGPNGFLRWRIVGNEANRFFPRTEWEANNPSEQSVDLNGQPRVFQNRHRYTETIGGQRARMWNDQYSDGTFLTRAVWDATGVVLEGNGPSLSSSAIELRIIHTVRFATTPP